MLTQKRGRGPFDLAWAAMARIAGIRENLGGRFARVQVGLGMRRHRERRKRDDEHAGTSACPRKKVGQSAGPFFRPPGRCPGPQQWMTHHSRPLFWTRLAKVGRIAAAKG